MKKANWIQKTHLFRSDEYICSACKSSFSKPYSICPECNSTMRKAKYEPSWVDEAESLSAMFDDDW